MSKKKKSFLVSGAGIVFAGIVMVCGIYYGAFADSTNRLGLDLVDAYQADKYATVNENTYKLDALVQTAVVGQATNPTDAAGLFGTIDDGSMFLVISSATSTWEGKEDNLAYYLNSAWTYFVPEEGWGIWDSNNKSYYVYSEIHYSGWERAHSVVTGGIRLVVPNGIGIMNDSDPQFSNYRASILSSAGYGFLELRDSSGNRSVQIRSDYITPSVFNGPFIFHSDEYYNSGQTIDDSVAIEIRSISKGFLPPSMSTSEMNGIVSPTGGIVIWNREIGDWCGYDGSDWYTFDKTVIP